MCGDPDTTEYELAGASYDGPDLQRAMSPPHEGGPSPNILERIYMLSYIYIYTG